jgi:hypothetical protein
VFPANHTNDIFTHFVHSRYSYRFDEILRGVRFLPAFSIRKDGNMAMELNRLNEVEEAAV